MNGRFCGAVFNDHGSLEVMFSLHVGFKDSNEAIVGDVTIITNLMSVVGCLVAERNSASAVVRY